MPGNSLDGLVPGSAAFYRKRFESSVMGNHMLMPSKELAANFVDTEKPPDYPCGPNTKFNVPVPMPYRFKEVSLHKHNARLETMKEEHPIYATTTSEFGKLGIQFSDLPMRWYGLAGEFTTRCTAGGMALPKDKVSTGLNTSLDRSKFHHEYDQGWRGNLSVKDFNIANKEYSSFVTTKPRRTPIG